MQLIRISFVVCVAIAMAASSAEAAPNNRDQNTIDAITAFYNAILGCWR